MFRCRHLAVVVLLVAALAAPAAVLAQTAPPPFTVEEMLKLRRVSDPQLSPDGTRVAFVITEVREDQNTRVNHIWVVPVAGGEPVRLVAGDRAEDRPRWSPDGSQIAFVSARDGSSQVWLVPSSGGEPRKLTSIATEASGVTWSPDGKWVAFVSDVFPECPDAACNEQKLKARESSKVRAHIADGLLFRHWTSWKDGRFSHLFLVPSDASAPPRDLTPGPADVPPFSLGGPEDYAFSPDSKEIAFVKKTDKVEAISTNSDIFTLDLTKPGTAARQITTTPGADSGPLYSPDGKYLSFRSMARAGFEADRWEVQLYDRKSGERRSVTSAFDRPVDGWLWTADSKALYLTAEDRASVRVFRLDLAGGLPKVILGDGSNGDVQLTPDGRTIVFSRTSLTAPAEIFKASADGTGVVPITRVNAAALQKFALKPAESVTYAGAGGTTIQAWVVKPAAFKEGQKYPLLYLVHGGPQGAWTDGWTFRWNAQVFASAGYVVFMPNPRGSTGFGQQLTDEISGDWGGKPYDDLMKGADFAEGLTYVDKTRVGAAGASYGGYMMNWFLGHTTRFKAIVSHAGVFNLTSMYGVTEELWFPEWDLKGTPWTNPESYAKWSPHTYAKNFKTPTLVTHGEIDYRVPVGEGFQLFTTLQRQGVPSRLIVFPDEGHWINKPQNAALWYHSFVEWMDKWVK
jgi:dipeptidyl aminopeptidase/acylaminoacyl peptidase